MFKSYIFIYKVAPTMTLEQNLWNVTFLTLSTSQALHCENVVNAVKEDDHSEPLDNDNVNDHLNIEIDTNEELIDKENRTSGTSINYFEVERSADPLPLESPQAIMIGKIMLNHFNTRF